MNVNNSLIELNMSSPPENGTQIEGHLMTQGWRIVWDSFFGASMFLSILGNITIISMMWVDKWSVSNVFIINMSFSDLMLTTLNCICNYIYMRDQVWYFNETACSLNNFFAVLTISASVLNLTAMSVTRYYAVVFPLNAKPRRYHVTLIIALAWLCSVGLALPNIFYSKVFATPGGNICILDWSPNRHYEEVYNITLTLFTYVVPLIIITLTTIHMSIVLWGRSPPGEINQQLELSIKKKKKIVKLLWILLLVFSVCWLPYHFYFIIIVYFPHIGKWRHVQNLFLSFYLLAMSHAVVNPVVYFTFNKTLRQTLQLKLSQLYRVFKWNRTVKEVGEVAELPPEKEDQADEEMSESESQHVLSVLELIPLKCSPKHNGKFISFIATAANPSDEEKKGNEINGESHWHKSEPEKGRTSPLNGSFQRLKKGLLIGLNEFHQRIHKRKNTYQSNNKPNNNQNKEDNTKVHLQNEDTVNITLSSPRYTTV